jgi:mycothiol system anti-sigma-R factor
MDDCGHDCNETLGEVQRFIDGELDVTVRIRIEQHLSECHGCNERAEFRRHLKLLIARRCGEEAVPASLEAKVRELIDRLDAPTP